MPNHSASSPSETQATGWSRAQRLGSSAAYMAKAIGKARKTLAKARGGLEKKGSKRAKGYLKAVSTRMFRAAFTCTDALLPDEVRVTLPGDGLDW